MLWQSCQNVVKTADYEYVKMKFLHICEVKTYICSCQFVEVLEQVYRTCEGCCCAHLQHTLGLFQNILQRWNDQLMEESPGYCLLMSAGYYPSSLQTTG